MAELDSPGGAVKRLRAWWCDDRVRTVAATCSVRRDLLMEHLDMQYATTAVVERVRAQVQRSRLLDLGAIHLDATEDFAANRVTIRASIRVTGYPSRRWLVARDRVAAWLAAPVTTQRWAWVTAPALYLAAVALVWIGLR